MEFKIGLMSPFDSLKFFARHKYLLVSGLAPHLAAFILYYWTLFYWFLPKVTEWLPEKFKISSLLLGWVLGIVGFVTYSIIVMPIWSVILSPIHDWHAAAAYAETRGYKIRPIRSVDFVRSFLNECSKAVFLITFLILTIVFPLIAPVSLICSIWFFGWDMIDRTLSLQGLSFKERLNYGFRHWAACLGLGCWLYVPMVGTLLVFVFAGAGAISQAKLESSLDALA